MRVGVVLLFDGYDSQHASLAPLAKGGDLYLVTVRPGDVLWLVGVLRRPRSTGARWQAARNVAPVADASRIVGGLRFESGAGVNAAPGKLGMSLQTPRALTSEDVAFLESLLGSHAKGSTKTKASASTTGSSTTRMTKTSSTKKKKKKTRETGARSTEGLVVSLAARLLGVPEETARRDRGRYAVFHWDDGFHDLFLRRYDWASLPSPAWERKLSKKSRDFLFGRADFDMVQSLYGGLVETTGDKSLRALLARTDGWLTGAQVTKLVAERRIDPKTFGLPAVYGRVDVGESLFEAVAGLFMLHDLPRRRMSVDTDGEIDPRWKALLAAQEPSLRDHLAVFFQTEEGARAFGAHLDKNEQPRLACTQPWFEAVATWSLGEGQGSFGLVRTIAEPDVAVPVFEGYELLTRGAAAAKRGARTGTAAPAKSWSLAELDALRLSDVLGEETEFFLPAIAKAVREGRSGEAMLAGLALAGPSRLGYDASDLKRRGKPALAYAWLNAAIAACPVDVPSGLDYLRAEVLRQLGHLDASIPPLERVVASPDPNNPVSPSHVHGWLAEAHAEAGRWAEVRKHAAVMIADKKKLAAAKGHALDGRALFALGKGKEAFVALEKAMKASVDPGPQRALAEDPRYRALAARHGIPVQVAWPSSDREVARG
ncbi:MAG: hypothetical protein JST00_34320 [Deltaproteobacteria bacterium]|nr:hypothetical protein [Deltaproteobacteria bacterium]